MLYFNETGGFSLLTQFPNRLLPKVAIVLLLLASHGMAVAEDVRLPRDRDTFFKHDGLTFSDFLQLRSDGSYRQIAREHLYTKEMDRGSWEQNDAGELILNSDLHFHNINSGQLFISMWHRDELKALPELKERIQTFLKSNHSLDFLAKDVERIKEASLSFDPKTKIGRITVLGSKRVKRADLEGLLMGIDTFLSSDEKNLFAFVPLEYNRSIIFVEDDRAQLAMKVVADELARPPHPSHHPDKHGYHEIDAARFHEEIKETQPFLFYPEMNKRNK